MTQILAYAMTGAAIFCIGVFGVFFVSHLLKRLMALNIMAVGVFLVLVAVAKRNAAREPDPVPHAMLLTGIVVAVSASAFAVRLARSYHDASGDTDLDEGGTP
ncbi:MAG: NADH-quinone oxidoreductase subunit K [Opitutales bacterium]